MELSDIDKANVAKQIEKLLAGSSWGGGNHFPEIAAQNFTDSVDALMSRTEDEGLRQYILEQAKLTGEYCDCDEPGRWVFNHEEGDIEWIGPPLE